ncbi:FtsW/RodA/SpoVE family cell cycle protein [Kitasatospora sp. NPDC089509]|uniref:FtsW/RodA/SpoVE family cell cycle protein n=1 Tax=Kitasatospora sp. NPDC089509 TaxID=3364079 RepID=UPI0037FC29A6
MQSTARGDGRRLAVRHRNIELGLLALAVAVCLAGHIDASLALTGKLPPGLLVHGLSLGALVVVAHLAVRRYAPYADPLILPLGVFLTGFGLMLLDRLDFSYKAAHAAKGDYQKLPAAPSQLMWVFISVAAALALIVFVKHHRFFQRYVYVMMAGALILLTAPIFSPTDSFGAKRWIKLPGLPSFEPDEFVKVAITIFFAGYLMASRDALALAGRKVWGMTLPRGRHAGPVLAIWAVSLMVLIFERDLGTSLIFFGVFVVMLYVATERTSWVVLGLLMAVGGAAVVGTVEPHVHGRVEAWLHPLDYYPPVNNLAISSQPAEALFSLGTGHMTGTGLGSGRPWLIGFAGRSDFIFTTIGEELGLAGVTAVLLVYVLLIQRGLRTAIGLTDPFGKLLATGLSAALALQVFVVVGGVSGLVPLTGKALPFLAAGGSSLLANWLMIALLIKLSDSSGRTALDPAQPSPEPLPVQANPANRPAVDQATTAPGPGGSVTPAAGTDLTAPLGTGPGGPGTPAPGAGADPGAPTELRPPYGHTPAAGVPTDPGAPTELRPSHGHPPTDPQGSYGHPGTEPQGSYGRPPTDPHGSYGQQGSYGYPQVSDQPTHGYGLPPQSPYPPNPAG